MAISKNGFEDPISLQILPQGEGAVLGGRFKLTRFLGAGSVGAVYEAYDGNRSESVAIKVFFPALVVDSQLRERLINTARLNSKLIQPEVVRVFGTHEGEGLRWVSMELVKGESFRSLIDGRKGDGRHFELQEVGHWIGQLVGVLKVLSSKSGHLGIKPENLFLLEDGRIKVSDFGFQACLDRPQMSYSSLLPSMIGYQAPEMLRGERVPDSRGDQFSVAAVAYELLSGERPAGVVSPLHTVRRDVNGHLEKVLNRALSSDPDERFSSLDEFDSTFESALRGKSLGVWFAQGGGGMLLIFSIWGLTAFALPDSSAGRLFRSLVFEAEENSISLESQELWNRVAVRVKRCDFSLADLEDYLEFESELAKTNVILKSQFLPEPIRDWVRADWGSADRETIQESLERSRQDLDRGRWRRVIDGLVFADAQVAHAERGLGVRRRYLEQVFGLRSIALALSELRGNQLPSRKWLDLLADLESTSLDPIAANRRVVDCSCSGFGRRKRRVCNDSDFVILYDLTI